MIVIPGPFFVDSDGGQPPTWLVVVFIVAAAVVVAGCVYVLIAEWRDRQTDRDGQRAAACDCGSGRAASYKHDARCNSVARQL